MNPTTRQDGIFGVSPPARSRVFDPMDELRLRSVLDNLIDGSMCNRDTLVETRSLVLQVLALLDVALDAHACAERDLAAARALLGDARRFVARVRSVFSAPGESMSSQDLLVKIDVALKEQP